MASWKQILVAALAVGALFVPASAIVAIAFQWHTKRGIKEVDLSAHQAAWDAVAKKTRQRLVGRVYSKSLLDSVTELVGKNGD